MSAWRVILTDSEDLTGVAPVCPQTTMKHHVRIDSDLVPSVDEYGVYDCCPQPHIECWGTVVAQAMAAQLTATDAELCP